MEMALNTKLKQAILEEALFIKILSMEYISREVNRITKDLT